MAKGLRSGLYKAARAMGNVEAAGKGPGALGKRVVRKKIYAKSNSITRQGLKTFKLGK